MLHMNKFNWPLDEEEIHDYIIEAFKNKGYNCENFHEGGAPAEDGIDILSHKKEEQIAIAVKIAPKLKDISQLKRLAQAKTNKKIYVHIKSPTKRFYDEIHRLKNDQK